MTLFAIHSRILLALVVGLLASPKGWAGDDSSDWKAGQAGKYLDERAKSWFAFSAASRGEGATGTTCISCHTLVPYALARPVLRKLTGTETPTEYEKKLFAQIKRRVENWKDLDTAQFGLLYDFSDRKKKEAWGTEAVLNAFILASGERSQGRTLPSDLTNLAFSNLWQTQVLAGDQKGSWDWLDFQLEPWESKGAQFYGAALAAIAVGMMPLSSKSGADVDTEARVKLLRGYLHNGHSAQNLHNRAWALWASTKLDGVLTKDEQKNTVDLLINKQQEDGGWSLSSLGSFVRSDGTGQASGSDGYATGLVLHVLQTAGVRKDDSKIAKGLAWLRANQLATGDWRSESVNKKRNPTTHVGNFMSDAATAYAVLALSHP